MSLKLLSALVIGWAIAFGCAAGAELLEPTQAFHASAFATGPDLVEIRFQIAPGYYMYQKKLHFHSATDSLKLGKPQFPKAEMKKDEFFGVMGIYRGDVVIRLPIGKPLPTGQVAIQVEAQGCAELIGACYPAFAQVVFAEFPPPR